MSNCFLSLFHSNTNCLARSVDRNHVDLAATFALGCDLAGFAYRCDFLIAADISQLRSMSGRHQLLALLKLRHACLDLICFPGFERNFRLRHSHTLRVRAFACPTGCIGMHHRAGSDICLLTVFRYVGFDDCLVCLILLQALLRPLEGLIAFDGLDFLWRFLPAFDEEDIITLRTIYCGPC